MNLATKLTCVRILLAPVGVALLFASGVPGNYVIALVIFIIADVTDAIDGTIARKTGTASAFGAFLDGLADRLLVLLYLSYLLHAGVYPLWLYMCMLIRELVVASGRSFLVAQDPSIGAVRSGKPKAFFQFVSIVSAVLSLAIVSGQMPVVVWSAQQWAEIAYWTLLIAFVAAILGPKGTMSQYVMPAIKRSM